MLRDLALAALRQRPLCCASDHFDDTSLPHVTISEAQDHAIGVQFF